MSDESISLQAAVEAANSALRIALDAMPPSRVAEVILATAEDDNPVVPSSDEEASRWIEAHNHDPIKGGPWATATANLASAQVAHGAAHIAWRDWLAVQD